MAISRIAAFSRRAKDELPGGKAEGKDPSEFDQDELEKGIKVEREHTDDDDLAEEIASDHLAEFPNYYEELEKMETKLKKQKDAFSSNRSVEEIMREEPEVFNSTEPQKNDDLAPIGPEEEGGVYLSNQNEKEARRR